MRLYFLRHGKADWPDWNGDDDDRPLTKEGKREMERIAEFLAELEIEPAAILSSPLPRASQTAEIAADALGMPVQQVDDLGKGFSLSKLRPLLERADGEDLMLVGHEPDFTTVIGALTGADAKLGKGGIARVDLENSSAVDGKLVWLIPPKIARR
jgi:phosphohistidine phosphatase